MFSLQNVGNRKLATMVTDTRLIDLNPFQLQGLETVVVRLRKVLWLCADGDVSFDADEYIQSHVLNGCIATPRRKVSEIEENQFRQGLVDNGSLYAVFRLFHDRKRNHSVFPRLGSLKSG